MDLHLHRVHFLVIIELLALLSTGSAGIQAELKFIPMWSRHTRCRVVVDSISIASARRPVVPILVALCQTFDIEGPNLARQAVVGRAVHFRKPEAFNFINQYLKQLGDYYPHEKSNF